MVVLPENLWCSVVSASIDEICTGKPRALLFATSIHSSLFKLLIYIFHEKRLVWRTSSVGSVRWSVD